jgi:predicted ester cyclase
MTVEGVLGAEKEKLIGYVTEFRKNVFLTQDVSRAWDYLHPELVDHFAPESDPPGIDGFAKRFTMALGAFKTEAVDVLFSVYDGDVLSQAIVLNLVGIGEFFGTSTLGKKFKVGGFDSFRFRDGKIAEHWGLYDIMKIPSLIGGNGAAEAMWAH